MIWRCKSRNYQFGKDCEHHCVVESDFEPRGCLLNATWQEWETVKQDKRDVIEDWYDVNKLGKRR